VPVSDAERRRDFEGAYRVLYGPICGYVLRRVADRGDAADVVAETFLTLWRRWDDAPGGDELRPWLYGVARRVAANQRRGNARRTALAILLAAEFQATVSEPFTASALDEGVARAFAALSDSDRELLALVAWEGLSPRELAVALGVSRSVARLRLHRARRRFAVDLSDIRDVQRIAGTGHVPLGQATACPSERKGES